MPPQPLMFDVAQFMHVEVAAMFEWFGNVKGDVPTIYKEDSMEFVPGFGIHGEKGSITKNGSER